MKEKIIIKNFSVLDDVEMDIKKINLLIGPQATGKSVIAKLVYFFKTIKQKMLISITASEGKQVLDKRIRSAFIGIFPEYFYQDQDFEITYSFDDYSIIATKEKGKRYDSIKISYSPEIIKQYGKHVRSFKKGKKVEELYRRDLTHLRLSISSQLDQFFYGTSPYNLAFIPAVRSFFVNLEKNIFTLLSQSAHIDNILAEFGSFYAIVKENSGNFINKPELYGMCADLLGGVYQYLQKEEWIKTRDDKLIRLRDSSSGQQKVAPLIVSLMALSGLPNGNFYMFIEEPEAHLFPGSQRNIVEIIAMVYNSLNREPGFFITTHSPYILTSFNNLIQADNTHVEVQDLFGKGKIDQKVRGERLKRLDRLIKPNRRVAFDDVAAYVVKEGCCKDIRHEKNRLIAENDIDEVSGRTDSIFDQLLNIMFGD